MKLSQKEEELMGIIWQLEPAQMKDILELYPEPKPAVTTLATLLKRMADKGAIGYELEGKSRNYFSKVKKEDYSSSYLKNMIKTFFQGSTSRFASFFTNKIDLDKEQLKELRAIIDEKLKEEE